MSLFETEGFEIAGLEFADVGFTRSRWLELEVRGFAPGLRRLAVFLPAC
jgi:hypothetical protein